MKLQEWRNEAPENEQMYEDIKGIMEMGSFLKGMDSLHKENALENILKRTRQRSLGYSNTEICSGTSVAIIARWHVILCSYV